MKGIVFTELMEMMEEEFGYEVVDKVIEQSELENDGAYTAVGTYPFDELVKIVVQAGEVTQTELPVLLNGFGHHLFKTFVRQYPSMIGVAKNGFEFLSFVDGHIHVEVRKLYPDAELPHFTTEMIEENKMEMIYTSSRKLSDLAEGLIEASMEHFKMNVNIEKEVMDETGTVVKFLIEKIQ